MRFSVFSSKMSGRNWRNCSLSSRILYCEPWLLSLWNLAITVCSPKSVQKSTQKVRGRNVEFIYLYCIRFITWKSWCCYHPPPFNLFSVLNDQSTFFLGKWPRFQFISKYSPCTRGFAVEHLSRPFHGKKVQLTNWSEEEISSFALSIKYVPTA